MTAALTLKVSWEQDGKKIDGFEQHFLPVERGRFVCLCGQQMTGKALRSHFWTCETVQWAVLS